MKLDNVQISLFRNITEANFTPSPSLNIITGRNGSGKSSLLEALYYLGFGRSFRTNKHSSVIQNEQTRFSVFAQTRLDSDERLKVGIQRGRDEFFVCSVNGERSNRLADLVSLIPLQLFTPQSTDLLVGSPSERRRFCDWGLFHVEQSFNHLHATYTKLLKQRNALLKQQVNLLLPENVYWQQQIVQVGNKLNTLRSNYVKELQPLFKTVCEEFLPEFNVTIEYSKGWEKDLTFEESLIKKYEYDGKIGHTSNGPHKADLKLKINGVAAGEILSRGQMRMAVAALQLAQTSLFTKQSGRKSIFLLDDIGAELDVDKRERFISGLIAMETQMFITAIEPSQLSFLEQYKDKKMFHVEHGRVKEELN